MSDDAGAPAAPSTAGLTHLLERLTVAVFKAAQDGRAEDLERAELNYAVAALRLCDLAGGTDGMGPPGLRAQADAIVARHSRTGATDPSPVRVVAQGSLPSDWDMEG